MRRPLGKDKPAGDAPPAGERFYAVDGDYFVLRYAEAVTLNVEYILLAEAEGSAGEAPDDDAPATDADRDAAANGSR